MVFEHACKMYCNSAKVVSFYMTVVHSSGSYLIITRITLWLNQRISNQILHISMFCSAMV